MKLPDYVLSLIKEDASGKRDLSALYADASFQNFISGLASFFAGKADAVMSPESMGFILGSSLAMALHVPFIPVRNNEAYVLNLDDCLKASYIDHHDNARTLQIRKELLPAGRRVILADDWVGTAATMQALITITEEAEAVISGIVSIGADYNKATSKLIDSGLLITGTLNK